MSTAYGCLYRDGKYRVAILRDGCRSPEVVGPPFDRPREAIDLAMRLEREANEPQENCEREGEA
jgi:hypothetical protein